MIAGFKPQFHDYVLNGTKTHTIRKGHRWRVGMRLDAFANVRQKDMRLLLRVPVIKVEDIRIEYGEPLFPVFIAGELLDEDERNVLAWRDGFRFKRGSRDPNDDFGAGYLGCFGLMMDFWIREHGVRFEPFVGQIVHWDFAERFYEIGDSCNRITRSLALRGLIGATA